MEIIDVQVGEAVHSTRVIGPADGPLVLCLHGFPDVPQTFDRLLAGLAAAGYRAAAPTMRGYAPGCQPRDGDYRIASIARDVVGFIDGLGAEKAHVFGHDWGAVVGYAVGAQAPERLISLATLAVPPVHVVRETLGRVPRQIINSGYQLFFQIPGLSDWLASRRDWAWVRRLCRRWSPGLAFSEAEWVMRCAAFDAPGVRRAMLSWYRQNLHPLDLIRGRGIFAPTIPGVPLLAATGQADGCMDSRLYDALRPDDFPAGLRIERLSGLGHFAHLEEPAAIEDLLLDWLRQHG